MTTIAFDGKTMACDTRVSGSHTAARAITVAAQFDTNTGGKIITKQLLG